jgi:CubicO group peptidase (beta-lactamase class C family)
MDWHGRQIIPAAWIRNATTVRADQRICGQAARPHRSPTATRRGSFPVSAGCSSSGARGQRIYVDPQGKLVMVNTAVHGLSVDVPRLREMDALWWALVRQLGG